MALGLKPQDSGWWFRMKMHRLIRSVFWPVAHGECAEGIPKGQARGFMRAQQSHARSAQRDRPAAYQKIRRFYGRT